MSLTRQQIHNAVGRVPTHVRCHECGRTVANARWNDGMGYLTPSHRATGRHNDRFGYCLGTGHYGTELPR